MLNTVASANSWTYLMLNDGCISGELGKIFVEDLNTIARNTLSSCPRGYALLPPLNFIFVPFISLIHFDMGLFPWSAATGRWKLEGFVTYISNTREMRAAFRNIIIRDQGLYTLIRKTYYHQISWSLADAIFQLSYRSEIWQASPQPCCRRAHQMSERLEKSKPLSCGFESSRDSLVSRPTA